MSGKEDQSSFRLWCRKELSKYLYQTLTDEVLDYLMTIDTEDNMREYLVGLLGESNQTLLFIKEFIRHWKLIQPQTTPTGGGAPPEGHDGDMQELQRPSPEKMVLFSKETKETKVDRVNSSARNLNAIIHRLSRLPVSRRRRHSLQPPKFKVHSPGLSRHTCH